MNTVVLYSTEEVDWITTYTTPSLPDDWDEWGVREKEEWVVSNGEFVDQDSTSNEDSYVYDVEVR